MTRVQLLAAGLSADAIGRAIRSHRLHPVHAGVYAAGHPELTVLGRRLAAVLACGHGAALSHRAATAHHGLRRAWLEILEVSAARSRRCVPGVILHRPRSLPPEDVEVVRGVPVTTVSRTLVDLADVVSRRTLDRVLQQVEMQRVHAVPTPIPGRRGTKRLEAALAALRVRVPHMTRSELEDRMIELCREFGLPAPDTNFFVDGQEVDFTWAAHRVAVEVDGWESHGTRTAFQVDRRRSTELVMAGWTVLRFTYYDIVHDRAFVARALTRVLGRQRGPS
jgi:hypothetical protein